MRLSDYGYSETDNSRVRHQSLGRAVRAVGYKRVLSALSQRMSRKDGYRFERLRADRNWLKKRMMGR